MSTEGTATASGAGPEPPFEAPVGLHRRKPSWPARVAIGFAVVLAAAVAAGFVVRVPYTTIAPGDALSLPTRVSVQGAKTYPKPRGDIRLLFVREEYHVTLWQYLRARVDSDIDLAKDVAVNPDNLSPAQQNDQGLQQMADAKNAATVVALRAAGYKVDLTSVVAVTALSVDLPASKVLRFGDVILTADAHPVTSAQDLTAAIMKHRAGEQVTLVVLRAGKRVVVHVGIVTYQGRRVIGVGVDLSPRFTSPVKVAVDTTGIGGPSAGLAMTLAIFDDLTPGDLTGGQRVAVTGTIDVGGNVGEIGGIEQKAIAARAAGVKLFIVPQCSPGDPAAALAGCKSDLARAAKRAGSKIKVMPVSTFAQALEVLRANGGAPVTATVPTTSTTTAG